MGRPELRTDFRSRWPGYLATAAVLVFVVAVIAFAVWKRGHTSIPEPDKPPPGFSSEWRCASRNICRRDLPPAKPRP